MPDRCSISQNGAQTVDARGAVTTAALWKSYHGSTDIPCRLDSSRSFRPVNGLPQEANANEYILHLPLEVEIAPNEALIVNGRKFESRKSTNQSVLRFTNEFLVVEVETQ